MLKTVYELHIPAFTTNTQNTQKQSLTRTPKHLNQTKTPFRQRIILLRLVL